MQCDMCGADGYLVHAIVEGTEMRVCKDCSKFGKIFRPSRPQVHKDKKIVLTEPEIIQTIKEDYHIILKKAREKKGLKQEELAKMIAEKESVIHQLESKHLEPNIDLAKKLERKLKVRIIEETETKAPAVARTNSGPVTLGDVIKIRKRG